MKRSKLVCLSLSLLVSIGLLAGCGGATKEASINASLMCARGIEEVYEGKKPTYPVPGF